MCGCLARCKQRFLLLFLLIVSGIVFVTTVPGSASADTAGPQFTGIFPANGAAISSAKVTISLTAVDSDMVDMNSVVMTLDNVPVKPGLYYDEVDYSVEDNTRLNIYYPANLSEGLHNVSVAVKDRLNNSSSVNCSFTVGEPPKITLQQPAAGSTVNTLQPVISAKVTDNAGIDPSSIAMTVNGSPVQSAYDPFTSMVSFTPADPLNNEAFYEVSLQVKDTSGIRTTSTWKFYVNTYLEMTFPQDDINCQKCHARAQHPMTKCSSCHGINLNPAAPKYPLDDCYNCHFSTPNPPSYHTSGLPYSMQAQHRPQSTDSCTACHTKTWGVTIPTLHNTFDTAVRHLTTTGGCSQCHATSLTREHQRRTDDSGNPLNCYTCHGNADPNVQNAIKTKDSSCGACHAGLGANGGHPAHDNNGLDANCQTCHSTSILSEPQFHQKNGCQTCHNNQREIVKYSIQTNDTNCFSCHTQGHNVNFVRQIPADVPIYPGFEWSVPQPATIWAGEAWLPAEYNSVGSKLVISNRRQGLTGGEIFAWYEQQMAGNGWQKVDGPAAGSDNFLVTYAKGNRKLAIILYTGETHDPASPFVGYRLEILYK